jgi:hypothetical protein
LGDRAGTRFRRRSYSSRGPPCAAAFHHLNNSVALLGIKATELVLDVETRLSAEVKEVFAVDVKLARQGIYTDFLLQSELLYSLSPVAP